MKQWITVLLMTVSLSAHAERRWIKILDVYAPYKISLTSGCSGGYQGFSVRKGGFFSSPVNCNSGRLAIPKQTGAVIVLGLKGPNCDSDAPERYIGLLANTLSGRTNNDCLYIRPLEDKVDVMNDILVEVGSGSLEIIEPLQLRKAEPRSRRDQNCVSDNDIRMHPDMALPALSFCPYVVSD